MLSDTVSHNVIMLSPVGAKELELLIFEIVWRNNWFTYNKSSPGK